MNTFLLLVFFVARAAAVAAIVQIANATASHSQTDSTIQRAKADKKKRRLNRMCNKIIDFIAVVYQHKHQDDDEKNFEGIVLGARTLTRSLASKLLFFSLFCELRF